MSSPIPTQLRTIAIGFSRGAYQVRALAGMIATVGLMFPGNQEQIPFAYELYSNHLGGPADLASDIVTRKRNTCMDDPVDLSEQRVNTFRRTFSRPGVEVHFLGAWDTVSSIGLRRGKLLPLTTKHGHIKHFRHALALDERRVKFLPEHVEFLDGGERDESHVKEVWFAGTHSDIGGGNVSNVELDRGAESLVWMMNEAEQAGLKFDPTNLGQDVKRARVVESLTTPWRVLEYLPLTRLASSGVRTTNRPHLGRGRRVPKHHKIHYSVLANRLQADDGDYEPRAKFEAQEWGPLFEAHEATTVWDGDFKLVNALKIIREVDDELIKTAKGNSDGRPWLDSVIKHLQDGAFAKMIWEYGGLRFLLKIARFNDENRVRDIVRDVVGTHTGASHQLHDNEGSPSGSSIQATLELKTQLVLEGIPRLRDLLLCYGEVGPVIDITSKEVKGCIAEKLVGASFM
ncbi:hypothetical protein FRC06_000860 [Ceratobasidium sp. 370]|nr:hypothetical protein FRC06_000860 [Ceratobasidium sp. 370]